MTLWTWSKTAANNATADSTINWAEGQAPSSVNDSARAVMAAAAKYRDDQAGVTLAGTSTAYTMTSNQIFDSLAHMDGAVFVIIPNVTSGATPTLAVDGLAAKAIHLITGVSLPTGLLIAGNPYAVKFSNSNSEFVLLGAGLIPDASVTYAKMQTVAASSLIGNATVGTAAPTAVGLSTGLSFSGSNLVGTAIDSTSGAITISGLLTRLSQDLRVAAATKSDQTTASSNTVAITPLHQQDHDSAAKAWVQFGSTGVNGAQTINASYNVSSVTRTSAGVYSVNLTTSFASANYACVMTPNASSNTHGQIVTTTASQIQLSFVSIGSSPSALDPTGVHLICYGRQ